MATLNVDDSVLQAQVGAAILASLTQQKRDELIHGAILSLLSQVEEKDRWGNAIKHEPPIVTMFKDAARRVAEKIAREMLENDDNFKKQVRELFNAAWEKSVSGDAREMLIHDLATSIAKGLSASRDR